VIIKNIVLALKIMLHTMATMLYHGIFRF